MKSPYQHLNREAAIGLASYGAALAAAITAIVLGVPWWIISAVTCVTIWTINPVLLRRLRRAGARDRAAVVAAGEHDRALIVAYHSARRAVATWLHLGGKSFHA